MDCQIGIYRMDVGLKSGEDNLVPMVVQKATSSHNGHSAQHNGHVTNGSVTQEQEIDLLKTEYERKISDLEKEYASKEQTLKEELGALLEREKQKYESEKKEEVEKLEKKLQEMRDEYEEKIEKIQDQFKGEIDDDRFEKLRLEGQEREAELRAQLSDAVIQFEDRIRQVQNDCDNRLDQQLEKCRKEHQEEIEAITLDCETQKSDLETAHCKEREDIERSYNLQLRQSEQQFSDEFDQLNKHHMEEMKTMKDELTSDHQKLCDNLQQKLDFANSELDSLRDQLDEAKHKLDVESQCGGEPAGGDSQDYGVVRDFVERIIQIDEDMSKKLARTRPQRRMSGSPGSLERRSPGGAAAERRLSGSPALERRMSTGSPSLSLDSSLFRPLTPEEDVASLSQHLCMSLFTGPAIEEAEKNFLHDCAERLGQSVNTVMEMYTAAMRQVEETQLIQTDLKVAVDKKQMEISSVNQQRERVENLLNEERTLKDELAAELQKVEAQLEAALADRSQFEVTIQNLTSESQQLNTDLQDTQRRLDQFLSTQDELSHRQADLDQREKLMELNVGTESKGFLEENQRLAAEKRDIEKQFDKDRDQLQTRCQQLEQLLEEQQLELDNIKDEYKSIVDDLNQQINALDDKLRSNNQFLDEQTRDREQERDEHHKLVTSLEERLRDMTKHGHQESRLNTELDEVRAQLEVALGVEQEITHRRDDLERECQCYKERVEELIRTTQSMDKQMAALTEERDTFQTKVSGLEEELSRQQEVVDELQQRHDVTRQTSDTQISNLIADYQAQLEVKTRAEQQALNLKRDLEKELDNMRKSEEELIRDKEMLQKQCNERLQQISKLEMSLDQLRYPQPPSTMTSQGETSESDDVDDVSELKRLLEAEREAMKSREREVSSLADQLDVVRAKLVERTEEMNQNKLDTDVTVKETSQKLAEVEKEFEEMKEKLKSVEQERDQLKAELDSSVGGDDDGISAYAKMLIDSKNQEIDFLNGQVAYFQEDLEELKKAEGELTNYKERYEDMTKKLEELTDIQERWDQLKAQLDEKETSLGELRSECDTKKERIAELESQCETLKSKLDEQELQEDYDTVSDMLEDKTQEVEQLSQDLLDSKQTEVQLKETRTEQELELRALKKDLHNKDNIIEEKEEEIYVLKEKLEEKEKEMETMAEQLNDALLANQNAESQPSNDIPPQSANQNQHSEPRDQTSPANQQHSEPELVPESANQTHSVPRDSDSANDDDELVSRDLLTSLRDELEQKSQKISDLENVLDTKNEEIENLRNTVERFRGSGDGHALLDLRQKIEGYQMELDGVRSELDRTQGECTRLQRQMFIVDSERNELEAKLKQDTQLYEKQMKVQAREHSRRVREAEEKCDKLEQELNDMRECQLNDSDVDRRVSDVSRKMAEQHKSAMDKLCEDYDQKLQTLQSDHKDKLQTVHSECRDKLNELTQQHNQTLIHTETEHKSHLRSVRDEYDEEIQKLHQQYETQIELLNRRLEVQRDDVLEEQRRHQRDLQLVLDQHFSGQDQGQDSPDVGTPRSMDETEVAERLRAEVLETERLDSSLMKTLQSRDREAGVGQEQADTASAVVDTTLTETSRDVMTSPPPQGPSSDVSDVGGETLTCPQCRDLSRCIHTTDTDKLQRLLSRIHREGVQVLTMSDLQYIVLNDVVKRDVSTSPRDVTPDVSRVNVLDESRDVLNKSWADEREALVSAIRELTELISAADTSHRDEGNDWRVQLVRAISHVFQKERDALQARLRVQILGDGDGDLTLIERMERQMKEMAARHESAMTQVLNADHESLLAEIRDVRAHIEILNHQHKQDKLRHATNLSTTEAGSVKRERELSARVDLLQYKQKQDKVLMDSLRQSLDSEKTRTMELSSLLTIEKHKNTDLDNEILSYRRHGEQLKAQIEEEKARISSVMETFESERDKSERLENLVKLEQSNCQAYRQELEDLRRRADSSLERELQLKKQFESDLSTEREQHQKTRSLLDQERLQHQKLQNRLRDDVARFEECRRDLQTRLNDTRRLAQDRQSQIDRLTGLLSEEKSSVAGLIESLNDEKSAANTKQQHLTRAYSTISDLQSKLDTERQQNVKLQHQLDTERKRANKCDHDELLKKLRATISDLDGQIMTLQDEKQQLYQHEHQARQQLQLARDELDQKETENREEARLMRQKLQDQRRNVSADSENTRQKLQHELQMHERELEVELVRQRAEVAELEKTDLEHKYKTAKFELKQKLREKMVEIETLRNQLTAAELEHSKTKQKLEDERSASMDRSVSLRRTEQKLAETEAKLERAERRASKLSESLQRLETRSLPNRSSPLKLSQNERRRLEETIEEQRTRIHLLERESSTTPLTDFGDDVTTRRLRPLISDDDDQSADMATPPHQHHHAHPPDFDQSEDDDRRDHAQSRQSEAEFTNLFDEGRDEHVAVADSVFRSQLESLRQKLHLLTLKHEEELCKTRSQLLRSSAHDQHCDDLRVVNQTLDTILTELKLIQSRLRPNINTGSDDVRESVLSQNAELLQFVARISLEKQQLRATLANLEEEISVYRSQRNSDDRHRVVNEHRGYLDSRKTEESNSELRRLRERVNHMNEECTKRRDELMKMYGLYMRAESFRRNLVYQKHYLIDVIARYMKSDVEVLRELAIMGVHDVNNSAKCELTSMSRFKSAVCVVIAVCRMNRCRLKWTRAKRGISTKTSCSLSGGASPLQHPIQHQGAESPKLGLNTSGEAPSLRASNDSGVASNQKRSRSSTPHEEMLLVNRVVTSPLNLSNQRDSMIMKPVQSLASPSRSTVNQVRQSSHLHQSAGAVLGKATPTSSATICHSSSRTLTPPTAKSAGNETAMNGPSVSHMTGLTPPTKERRSFENTDDYINRLQNLQTRLTNMRPVRSSRPTTTSTTSTSSSRYYLPKR